MSKAITVVNLGPGVLGSLGVAFVVLKLLDIISWSWWLVLLPFYVGLVFVLGVVFSGVFGIIFSLVCMFIWDSIKGKKK